MKSLLVASALCFVAAVFGYPKPDQDLRLGNSKIETMLENGDLMVTTEVPETRKFTQQGTEKDRSKLMRDILTKYNKGVNPDDVKLEFGVNLIDFRVRPDNNAIESSVWLRYSWIDSRLAWKPEDYGGVEVLRIDSNALWIPDVTLYNSADTVNRVNCWDTNTVVFPTGKVIFVPPCKMVSFCEFSLRKQPYGNQECYMKFGSWTFDGNVLDLQFYNGTEAIDLSQLHNSSGFEVVSTTAERSVKYYPCCPDPYPDLTFNMTIRRIPAEELFVKLR
jgi:hypothetical protein